MATAIQTDNLRDISSAQTSTESFDLRSLLKRHRGELENVDIDTLAEQIERSMSPGAKEADVVDVAIRTAASWSFQEPQYSRLAARLVSREAAREVREAGVQGFLSSLTLGHDVGLIDDEAMAFARLHQQKLLPTIEPGRDRLFEYLGLRTLVDRYLLRHPESRLLIETPQFFFMRVAIGVSDTPEQVIELYNLFSSLEYLPSSPTLFNSATNHPQLSSCFLLDSPQDDLGKIYDKYKDVAMLSKFAGGIGLSYSRVRAAGSLIKGTNGQSRGIIPFINTLDSSVAAVNQGGRRKGACCVYLESWHADIETFLELRDNTGDEARRTHNLNIANWVPDLFMARVKDDAMWSLFDPSQVPEFTDLYGEEFEKAYLAAEQDKRYVRQVKARSLYARMMRTLAQTGNGWMCFKDATNLKSNQTAQKENVIHLSNLCTEIAEVTSEAETAVCNLGSINLSRHVSDDDFDFDKLGETTRLALRQLNRVIDRNYYPIGTAKDSNRKWRPVGLGCMGLQDVFFKLRLTFDGPEARRLSKKIAETIYYHALSESCQLAEKYGAHPAFSETRAAIGELEFDRWGVTPESNFDWDDLRLRIRRYGLRNSLMLAIAPTASIASIAGCYECIEPQVSNLFKKETLSGEFLQVNRYLVADLQKIGLWTAEIRDQIKRGQGSIQHIEALPEEVRHIYKTAWELPMKALIDLAADRGAFIDQSQSLNLFMEVPNIGKLSSMYYYAWERGLKTTYYLRSRPATRISQTTNDSASSAVACSLETPEYCEACQ